jgi:polysaccharide pyruvyl transferase WcaK-like protein
MRIVVIGWYGTETIGDRAILAGLISKFSQSFDNFSVNIGSLNPFFSERMLCEDESFWNYIVGSKFEFSLFDSGKPKELRNAIDNSEILIMGGGPLMQIDELYMVEYAFNYAKKQRKKTAILGCGVGPLFDNKYKNTVVKIILNSDLTILRDEVSLNLLESFSRGIGKKKCIHTSLDPAVECISKYTDLNNNSVKDYIAVNIRDFPGEYSHVDSRKVINKRLVSFIEEVSSQFNEREVRLVPMNYFHIGADDRVFMNKVALELQLDNLNVQNKCLSLEETMHEYQNAYFNVGMRFHSVVFQTLLGGRNFILDYTQPKVGKISGFLDAVNGQDFYKKRYVNLQNSQIRLDIKNEKKMFTIDDFNISQKLSVYESELKKLVI